MKEYIEFKSREELENAYYRGNLTRGVHYRVSGSKNSYRLCESRKGLAEVANRGR